MFCTSMYSLEDSIEEDSSSDSESDEEDARMDKLDKLREERSYNYHKVAMDVSDYSDVSLTPSSSSVGK